MIAERKKTDDKAQLWREYRANPTDQLHGRLVEAYLPLLSEVAAAVYHRLRGMVELDELVSTGYRGLKAAVDLFDPDRGFKFKSFAYIRIRGAMLDAIRDADWMPRLVRMQLNEVQRAEATLRRASSQPPTETALAELLGIDEAELARRRNLAARANLGSLSAPVQLNHSEDKKKNVADVTPDAAAEQPQTRSSKLDGLRELVQGLRQTERLIVLLYYYEELTMKEIGESLGLCESRISQMHTSILAQLRRRLSRTRGTR